MQDVARYMNATGSDLDNEWYEYVVPAKTDVSDAYARMFSWSDDLPEWCDQQQPIAVALQAALWIRILLDEIIAQNEARRPLDWYNLLLSDFKSADKAGTAPTPKRNSNMTEAAFHAATRTEGRRIPAKDWALKNFLKMVPEPGLIGPKHNKLAYRLDWLGRPCLDERYRYELGDAAFRAVYARRSPRIISPADVDAARVVIHHALGALTGRLANKERLRSYRADWTIIKLILAEHLPHRVVAARLDMDRSGSGVSGRFTAAMADIAKSVGQFDLDIPAPRLPWSRPSLTPQNEGGVCYTHYEGYGGKRRPAPVVLRDATRRWPLPSPTHIAETVRATDWLSVVSSPPRCLSPPAIQEAEKDRLVTDWLRGAVTTQHRPGRALHYAGEIYRIIGRRTYFVVDDACTAIVTTIPAEPRPWYGRVPALSLLSYLRGEQSWKSKPHKRIPAKLVPVNCYYFAPRGSKELAPRDCGNAYPCWLQPDRPFEVIFSWYDAWRELFINPRLRPADWYAAAVKRYSARRRKPRVRYGLTDYQYELIKYQAAERLARGDRARARAAVDHDEPDIIDAVEEIERDAQQRERVIFDDGYDDDAFITA
jgi:hypothetical protein